MHVIGALHANRVSDGAARSWPAATREERGMKTIGRNPDGSVIIARRVLDADEGWWHYDQAVAPAMTLAEIEARLVQVAALQHALWEVSSQAADLNLDVSWQALESVDDNIDEARTALQEARERLIQDGVA